MAGVVGGRSVNPAPVPEGAAGVEGGFEGGDCGGEGDGVGGVREGHEAYADGAGFFAGYEGRHFERVWCRGEGKGLERDSFLTSMALLVSVVVGL